MKINKPKRKTECQEYFSFEKCPKCSKSKKSFEALPRRNNNAGSTTLGKVSDNERIMLEDRK